VNITATVAEDWRRRSTQQNAGRARRGSGGRRGAHKLRARCAGNIHTTRISPWRHELPHSGALGTCWLLA